MESSLIDYTLMDDTPLGTRVGGWVDSFSETINHWGSWFSGSKPVAPAPEVELQAFHGTIHELPEEQEPLLGGHEETEADWGDDSELPGGDLEYDQIMELEAPPPVFGSEAYIHELERQELIQRHELGIEMQRVPYGANVGVESAELAEAELIEGSEIVAEAVEATSAGLLGGVAVGLIGAAAMIGITIGMNKLLGYLSKKKRVFKEKDDDPWMGYVGYFVIGKIWYPMIVDLVSHDHKIVTLEWKDMTGFTRHTNVKRSSVGVLEGLAKPGSGYNIPDPRVRFLNPPVRFKVPKYPKVVLKSGKIISFPYYKKFRVGTSVLMKDTKKRGMIVRGMIFVPNNEGYNKDGTYDKYRVRVGGTFRYVTPNQFMVKPSVPFKHGAPGKLTRWLPSHITHKNLRKKKLQARRLTKDYIQGRKDIYTRIKKRALIKKTSEKFNTTDLVSKKIIAADKAKKKEAQTLVHCQKM